MKLSFYGAAHTVTGSCFLLETDQSRILIDGYNRQKRLESEANIDAQIQDLSEEFQRKNEDILQKIDIVKQTMEGLVSSVGFSFPPKPDIHTTPKRKWNGESRLEDVVGEEEEYSGGVKGEGEDSEKEKETFFWGGDEEASAPRKMPFCKSREDQAQGSTISSTFVVSTPLSTSSTISSFQSPSFQSPRRTSTQTPMTPFTTQENCSSSLQINMTVEEDGEEQELYGEPSQRMPDYVD